MPAMPNSETGHTVNLTATGDVYTNAATGGNKDCKLLGFYVNSTSSGTVALKKGGSSGTALGGTITPAIGFDRMTAY